MTIPDLHDLAILVTNSSPSKRGYAFFADKVLFQPLSVST